MIASGEKKKTVKTNRLHVHRLGEVDSRRVGLRQKSHQILEILRQEQRIRAKPDVRGKGVDCVGELTLDDEGVGGRHDAPARGGH